MIPNTNEITQYLHCARCIDEILSGKAGTTSPRDYAKFAVGFTPIGLQIWCERHGMNIMHIDFEGHVHPANTESSNGKDSDHRHSN